MLARILQYQTSLNGGEARVETLGVDTFWLLFAAVLILGVIYFRPGVFLRRRNLHVKILGRFEACSRFFDGLKLLTPLRFVLERSRCLENLSRVLGFSIGAGATAEAALGFAAGSKVNARFEDACNCARQAVSDGGKQTPGAVFRAGSRRGYTTLFELSVVAALAAAELPVISLTIAKTIGSARMDRARSTGAMDAIRLRESMERDAMFATAVARDGDSDLVFDVPGRQKTVYRLESGRFVRRQGERVAIISLNAAEFDCAVLGAVSVRARFAPCAPRGGAVDVFDISVTAGGVR